MLQCMRMHPLIAEYDGDVTLLLDIAYHHGNNSGSSVSIDTARLAGVLMNVYRYQLGEGRRQCGCGEKFVKSGDISFTMCFSKVTIIHCL